MGNTKKTTVELSAGEFLAKHMRELAESEEQVSQKLLFSMFPQGAISLASLAMPSPRFEEWLQARAAIPGYRLMAELKQYWLVRLLRAAQAENSPQAFRELLEGWLIRLDIEAPEGVFLPVPRRRGAPSKPSTESVYRMWLQNGRPTWRDLAYHVHLAEYIRADSKERKKLRDRCCRAVRRQEARRRDQIGSN